MKFDEDVRGKRVLVRVDFNVPMERGVILSDNRIRQSMPTIEALYRAGAKVVLCSHLGRPKGKVDKKYSLEPIYNYIRCNIDDKIHWAGGIVGEDIVKQTNELDDGTSLLLENVRFDAGEEACDIDFARKLSENADYFVDDAFGVSHRKHASNYGVKQFLPSTIGLLMEKEREELSLKDLKRPFVAIMGGAKVKDKILVIKALLRKVDTLMLGGRISVPFLMAKGMKCDYVDSGEVEIAKDIIDYANKLQKNLVLPCDYVVSKDLNGEGKTKQLPIEKITSGYIVDIGKKSLGLFERELKTAETIFWNGPMGIFEIEKFAFGTKRLIDILSKSKAKTIVGGGDSAEAVEKMGKTSAFDYVSTGGGASLDYIASTPLDRPHKKLCLAILDGYGINETKVQDRPIPCGCLITAKNKNNIDLFEGKREFDAVREGTNETIKEIMSSNPHTLLYASGEYVGLPNGQMGNSEVGHLNIGAGEVVLQELSMINKEIETGEFYENSTLKDFITSAKGTIHLIGLASNGGIHSHINHLFACIELCVRLGVKRLALHLITDGRDTDIHSGKGFIQDVINITKSYKGKCDISISSLSGRYYAMDREKNEDRTDKYFDSLVTIGADISPLDAITKSYNAGVTDEFVVPISLDNETLKDGDSVIFFNFRADRMRQIVAKVQSSLNVDILNFTEYSKEFDFAKVAFKPKVIENCLSGIIASFGLKQLKVAETTKYAHVTYFLNGGVEEPKMFEDRVLIDMADVATFDLKPEMRAKEVADEVIKGFEKGYDFVAVNFANSDMVGHTGNFEASVQAVRAMTDNLLRVIKDAEKHGYIVVVVADHGNSEVMKNGENICTTHTTNRVPFVVINAGEFGLKNGGSLCCVTPTILKLMNLI